MSTCERPLHPELHPALAYRFSPGGFDPEALIGPAEVHTLVDAARRAPSAGNSQPWRFILGLRGDEVHGRIVTHLAPSASVWAPQASLLVVNLAHVFVDGSPDWEYSEFARYDLGQAVAHMTIQGLSIGLDAHQFRAFDRDALAAEFDVPPHWEVTSITAFGVTAHPPGARHPAQTSRRRADLDEIIWRQT